MDYGIQQIADMGFTHQQAEIAIKKADGDVNRAIELLLAGPITDEPQVRFDVNDSDRRQASTNQFGGSYSDPIGPSAYAVPEADPHQYAEIESILRSNDYLPQRVTEEENIYSHGDISSISQVVEKRKSIFETPRKFKKENKPTILTPVDTTFLENYFTFLVMMFHEVPALRNLILSKGFDDYSYRPNWWKDEIISVPPDTVRAGSSEKSLKFLMEIQRLLAFLDGQISKRSFAATKSFTRAIPGHLLRGLETESISDVLPPFYHALIDQINTLMPSAEEKTSNLFESTISRDGDSASTSVFQIEAEYVMPSVYESFHSLFWRETLENLGTTYFDNLADILTITYHETKRDYGFPGVTVEETFYPQIYTKKYEPIIRKMAEQRQAVREKHEEITKQQGKLLSFQGKRIGSIFGNTIDYFNKVSKTGAADDEENKELKTALEDLTDLDAKIKERKEELAVEGQRLILVSNSLNVYDVENILNTIIEKEEDSRDFESGSEKGCEDEHTDDSAKNAAQLSGYKEILQNPYFLTGVIINESEFYYLLSDAHPDFPNLWVHLGYEGDPKTTNFTAEAVQFENIRQHVKNMTKYYLSDTLVLIYAKSALLRDNYSETIPEGLEEFLEKDNENLEMTIDEAVDPYDDQSSFGSNSSSHNNYINESDLIITNETKRENQKPQEDINLIELDDNTVETAREDSKHVSQPDISHVDKVDESNKENSD